MEAGIERNETSGYLDINIDLESSIPRVSHRIAQEEYKNRLSICQTQDKPRTKPPVPKPCRWAA